MLDFEFISPTKLVFGRDSEARAGALVRGYAKRALVVLSRGRTNASGIVDRVLDSVKSAGVEIYELNGIVPNPTLAKVREGIETARRHDLGFILAIGGGSIIDTAKAIALGANAQGDVWAFFKGDKTPESALPVGVVLTIPAAGSEFSRSCVITNEEEKLKLSVNADVLRPVFAIENPTVSMTLDTYNTYAGIADMLVHVLERYISATKHTDYVDRLCEATMRSIMHNALVLLNDPWNYEARAEIMLCGTFAHNGLLGMGRAEEWASHGLGMSISALFGSTHGATLTVVTPAWMTYIFDAARDKLCQLAVRVLGVEHSADDPEMTAREGIYRLRSFFERIGMPTTLSGLGIPADEGTIKKLADNYGNMAPRGNIMPIYREDAVNIYELARL